MKKLLTLSALVSGGVLFAPSAIANCYCKQGIISGDTCLGRAKLIKTVMWQNSNQIRSSNDKCFKFSTQLNLTQQGVLMKKLSLALLSLSMMAGSLSAHAELTDRSTTTKPDIIRTTIGDLDAYGALLSSNKNALQRMDFDTIKTQAEQGNKDAQFYLAKMYQLGIHTSIDSEQAQAWYQKSADNGNIFAMNNLAVLLLSDSDIQDSIKQEKAIHLLKTASDQNLPQAMTVLAAQYAEEYTKNPKNQQAYTDSIALLTKAGEMGYAPAYLYLSEIYGKDTLNHEDKTEDDAIDTAKKDEIHAKRFEYLAKSAEMGDAYAQMALSDYYQMNGVMSIDKSVRPYGIIKSYEWAKRACANGVERGCQTARYFGGLGSDEIAVYELKCTESKKSTKKAKADNDACNTYEALKSVQQAINNPK